VNSTSKVSVSSIMKALEAQRKLNSSLTSRVVQHSSEIGGLRTDVDGLTQAVAEVVDTQGDHARAISDNRRRLDFLGPRVREIDARTRQSLDLLGAGVIAAITAVVSLVFWASVVFFGHWDPLISVVGNHTWHWTAKHFSGVLWFHVVVYSLICTGFAFAISACTLPLVSPSGASSRTTSPRRMPPEPDSNNEL